MNNKYRVVRNMRLQGATQGDIVDPEALGWRPQNVRAMLTQGFLELVAEDSGEPLELFKVMGGGGKFFVVEGRRVSDNMLKVEAEAFIEEKVNGDEAATG